MGENERLRVNQLHPDYQSGWSCACLGCGRAYMDRGDDEDNWTCRDCGSVVRRRFRQQRSILTS